MTHITDDDGDDLNDLIGGAASSIRSGAPLCVAPPASYQPRDFSEPCSKCGGTGRYHGWSGRLLGDCFACKGAGKKVFKASAEQRAQNREKAAARKEKNLALDIEAFKAEFPHIWSWMDGSTFAFAVSLRDGLMKYGSLTDRQIAAAESAIAKYEAAKAVRQAARAQTAQPEAVSAEGVDRLKKAFDDAAAYIAAKGLRRKHPKITVGGMTISPAPAHGRNPGALYVKTTADIYLGKVQAGQFFAASGCDAGTRTQVLAFIADPQKAAEVYGQETGTCCICNAELRSEWRLRGIGPICAEKFGW